MQEVVERHESRTTRHQLHLNLVRHWLDDGHTMVQTRVES